MDEFEEMLFGGPSEPEIVRPKLQNIKIFGTVTGRIDPPDAKHCDRCNGPHIQGVGHVDTRGVYPPPNINHNPPGIAFDLNAIRPAPPEFKRPAPRVVAPKGTGETNRITCVHCFRSWSGKTVAHCSACHETFSGVSLFDAHRREDGPHGYCLKPPAFRGMEFRDGMWRNPEMTDEEKARIWGK